VVSEVRRFVVTATGDAAALLAGLADEAGLRVTSSVVVERTFLDTADGRLAGADVVLELRRPVDGGASPSLVWVEDGRTVATADLAAPDAPRFAGDLPPWPTVDHLAGLLEMRALVPGPTIMSRLTTLAALDREEKTTARVVIDAATLHGGNELPVRLELHVLRGYEREADRLQKRLTQRLTLLSADTTPAAEARRLSGAPPFLRSKLRLSLDPTGTAAQAWRTVLQELTFAMTANFAGTLADTDSEFLHDFRVAVRRTRSVLQEGRKVLPPEARAEFREGFKWLGDITTPQRDADVHLLDFPGLVATVPRERAEALEPLRELLIERQHARHDQLVADLRSLRRAQLGRDWAAFIAGTGAWPADDGGEPGSDAPDALRPAIVVAATRIHKAHQRLVRDGRTIDDHSPAVALHDLRKDAKRLRYLLECFGSLFPVTDVATAVKPLKALQDTLGTFQDTEVQAHALAAMADELVDRGAGAATLLAMGAVIEHVTARGAAARKEFADRFAAFDSHSVNGAYERLSEDAEAVS
jgi:CHAD domain-containing protein